MFLASPIWEEYKAGFINQSEFIEKSSNNDFSSQNCLLSKSGPVLRTETDYEEE